MGDARLIRCLGVPLVYDQPHVGQNLHNHTLVFATLSANPKDVAVPEQDKAALYTGGAFLPALLPEDNKQRRGYQIIGTSPKPGVLMLIVIYLQPHSVGRVQIQSRDPLRFSLADNNYFGDPLDVQAFMAAIRTYVVQIGRQLHAIDSAYALLDPDQATIDSDDALKQWIYANFDHTHHWCGSCRMATSAKDGVVDSQGRVFGVERLRVADVSTAPVVPDGNTCAPAYVVAETVARAVLRAAR